MEVGSLVGAPGFQQAGVVQHSVATHAVVKIACWKAGYYSQRVVVGCQEDPLHRLVQEYSGCETLTVEDIHRIPYSDSRKIQGQRSLEASQKLTR